MKKFLSIVLSLAMLLTSTAFAAPMAVQTESTAEAYEAVQTENNAALAAVTTAPGINLLTGKEGLWNFETATNDDIAALFSLDSDSTESIAIANDPNNAENQVFAITSKTGLGESGEAYPKAYVTLSSPIEAGRPLFVNYKYYRHNSGTQGTDYTHHNALWLMQNYGNVIIGNTTSAAWQTYNDKKTESDATNRFYFQYNIEKTDKTATVMLIDDFAIIPAYAITYKNEDGTDYSKEYVHGVNDNGEPTNALHSLSAVGPASSDSSVSFLGWSTVENGTAADIIDTITIAGNKDFVLYPVYGEPEGPVITLKPGINLYTGKTGLWTFENTTSEDVKEIFTSLSTVEKVEVGTDPLDTDATDGTNHALAIVATCQNKNETITAAAQAYPNVTTQIPSPYIEDTRPVFISYRFYRYNPGTAGTEEQIIAGTADYIEHEAVWMMKNNTSATNKLVSETCLTNSGAWKSYSQLTSTKCTGGDITGNTTNIKFEWNTNKINRKASTLFIDDLAFIPAYAVIYKNTDGTEYNREYVNGVDANGMPTDASHKLIANGPAPTEPNKQFLGWSTVQNGTVIDTITIAGNEDFVLYPVYGDRYRDENAADMLGEIGELVYFENFNEFNEQTLVSNGTTYSGPTIQNDISVTGYDSLKVSYAGGYIKRNNPYTYSVENGNKYVTASFKGDRNYDPGVPRFYASGVTDDKAGKYFATMDIRIPEGSPFVTLSNQAYYYHSTGNGDYGHEEFGFYADRHTLTADEKSGKWITFMTDAIDMPVSDTALGNTTFNFGPTYAKTTSDYAYTMDFDNFAIYRILPRTVTLKDGESETPVVVEDITLDLTQYENSQDIEKMLVGWKKQDGTVIPAGTTSYVVKSDETLEAVYKPRYLGANATSLINGLNVPVELVFHSDFDSDALGEVALASTVVQDKSNMLTDSYIESLETKFYASVPEGDNPARSKSITVVEDSETQNRYYKAIHYAKTAFPPATPRFTLKSGAIQNSNAYYFAVLDVNIPKQVEADTEKIVGITKLSNQAYVVDTQTMDGVTQENGRAANFHTLTADEYDKWVTFKTGTIKLTSSNMWSTVFNFSPQYDYGKDKEQAEYEMSFDNFSLYAIVPRTVTLKDGANETQVTAYDVTLDLTQYIPTSSDPNLVFTGWKTDDGKFVPRLSSKYVFAEDHNLTAVWAPKTSTSKIDLSKYGTQVMFNDFNHSSINGAYGTLADNNGNYVPSGSDLFTYKNVWGYGGIMHWSGSGFSSFTHTEADDYGNRYLSAANGANLRFNANRAEAFTKPGAYYAVIDMRIPETNTATHMVNQIHNRYQNNRDGEIAEYADQYNQFRPGNEPDGFTEASGDSSKWLVLDETNKNGEWQTYVTPAYIAREKQAVPYLAFNFGFIHPDGEASTPATHSFDTDNFAVYYLPNRTVSFNVAVDEAGTTTALVEGVTINLNMYTPNSVPEGKVFAGWSETEDGAIIIGNAFEVAPDADGKTFYAVYVDDEAPTHVDLQIKISGTQGLRTISQLANNKLLENDIEFGYIVTRKVKLTAKNIPSSGLTFDAGLTKGSEYVSGTSYKKVGGTVETSILWDNGLGKDYIQFTGLFINIPTNMLDDTLVFRSYLKIGDGDYIYGVPVEASVRDVAMMIYQSDNFVNREQEEKDYIRNIVNS